MIESLQKNTLLCSCGNLMKCEYTYDPFEGGTPNDRPYREKFINDCRRYTYQNETYCLWPYCQCS